MQRLVLGAKVLFSQNVGMVNEITKIEVPLWSPLL